MTASSMNTPLTVFEVNRILEIPGPVPTAELRSLTISLPGETALISSRAGTSTPADVSCRSTFWTLSYAARRPRLSTIGLAMKRRQADNSGMRNQNAALTLSPASSRASTSLAPPSISGSTSEVLATSALRDQDRLLPRAILWPVHLTRSRIDWPQSSPSRWSS